MPAFKEHFDRKPADELAEAVERLADEAARAVTEPRRFHENEEGRQQALGTKTAQARLALRRYHEATSPSPDRSSEGE